MENNRLYQSGCLLILFPQIVKNSFIFILAEFNFRPQGRLDKAFALHIGHLEVVVGVFSQER
jgi:hypothetical protein